eukprot:4512280-Prorocentrum_lima.AAC.1
MSQPLIEVCFEECLVNVFDHSLGVHLIDELFADRAFKEELSQAARADGSALMSTLEKSGASSSCDIEH